MKKIMVCAVMLLVLLLAACSSETMTESVELNRMVPETEVVEVEGEAIEVTRVVVETVEVEVPLATSEWSGADVATEEDRAAGQLPPPEDMFFEDVGENPYVSAASDNLSTFAIDVDTGSYTLMRRYLTDGNAPPPESVRIEEYVNYFDYSYARPEGESFAIHLDGAPSPFTSGDGEYLVRVGIQGYEVPAETRPDMLLIFVVDTSGSMEGGNRLGQVKASLSMLTEQLRPGDRIGLIEYGSTAQIVLEPTDITNHSDILWAINSLQTNGSTNAEHGLQLAYQMADALREGEQPTRIILCSDGVANVGNTTPEAILEHAQAGITLSTFGFGMGNYNDVLMEQLADQGDGAYAYVDTPDEAERLFVENLTGTLLTIARDAKIQVEFNPGVIAYYRLLGYENRAVADEDFRNDTVDAGEIGSGHSVTALYEVRPVSGASPAQAALTVRVRYADPDSNEVEEIAQSLALGSFAESFETAPPSLQLAAVVAEYAERLSLSSQVTEDSMREVLREAFRVGDLFPENAEVQEFIDLLLLATARG